MSIKRAFKPLIYFLLSFLTYVCSNQNDQDFDQTIVTRMNKDNQSSNTKYNNKDKQQYFDMLFEGRV